MMICSILHPMVSNAKKALFSAPQCVEKVHRKSEGRDQEFGKAEL